MTEREFHGERVSGVTTEYRIYHLAKGRCRNPKNRSFKNYGGRGIEFRFSSFAEFLSDVGRRPSLDLTLDRIDNDGHYEKGNVRWATRRTQRLNSRSIRLISVNGVTKLLTDWAKDLGINQSVVSQRILYYGWCDKCAVTLPSHSRGKCKH